MLSVALRCGKGSPGSTSPVRWSGQWSALKRGFSKVWGDVQVCRGPSGSLFSNGGGTSGYVACCLRSTLNCPGGKRDPSYSVPQVVLTTARFMRRSLGGLVRYQVHRHLFPAVTCQLGGSCFYTGGPEGLDGANRGPMSCVVDMYLVPTSQLTESRLLCTWKEG